MKYTQIVIIGVVAAGFAAMFTLQSSDKIVNKKPTIDTTSAIVMVEESNSVENNFNYDSLNKILDHQKFKSQMGNNRGKTLKELKRFRQSTGRSTRAKF